MHWYARICCFYLSNRNDRHQSQRHTRRSVCARSTYANEANSFQLYCLSTCTLPSKQRLVRLCVCVLFSCRSMWSVWVRCLRVCKTLSIEPRFDKFVIAKKKSIVTPHTTCFVAPSPPGEFALASHVRNIRHGSLFLTRVLHAFASCLSFAVQSKSVLLNFHLLHLVYVRTVYLFYKQ